MSDPVVESLMLDLLEWISNPTERTYDEVMDAWRTSCGASHGIFTHQILPSHF